MERINVVTKKLPDELRIKGDVVLFPESACAVLIEDGALLLVEQSRPNGVSLELPGGKLEHGESAEDAAGRELEEEAGCAGVACRRILTLDLDLSVSIHKTHLVSVTGVIHSDRGKEFPVRWLPIGQLRAMVLDGTLTHAPTVTAALLIASTPPAQ